MCNELLTLHRCGCILSSTWTLCPHSHSHAAAREEECDFATHQVTYVEKNMCTRCRDAFLALPVAERLEQLLGFNERACVWNRGVGEGIENAEGQEV